MAYYLWQEHIMETSSLLTGSGWEGLNAAGSAEKELGESGVVNHRLGTKKHTETPFCWRHHIDQSTNSF